MFILMIFIIRFYLIDTTKYNNQPNYLLNLIEIEEKPIDDYCLNCQILQNSETIHCLICNKCIEGFDHHCHWLNKCIGAKNMNAFYHLLFALQTHSFINFCLCIIGRNGQFNDTYYFKDYIMLAYIALNSFNLIFTSIAVCPLIKFYYTKNKEKKKEKAVPVSESRIAVRIPSASDDEFV